MLGHGGSSAGSYLADPTSPIPSHYMCCYYPVSKCCSASIVVTSTVRVKEACERLMIQYIISFVIYRSS